MIDKKYYPTLVGISITLLFLAILGLVFYPRKVDVAPQSTFDVNPTTSSVTPSTAPDPVVFSWRTYSNDKYNFTVGVPSEWFEQEFSLPDAKEGTLVAFSPDHLPCKTCAYVYDGYFSVKVYNQKTDPDSYAGFTQRMNSISKSKDYQAVLLDGVKGVMFANTFAAENHGYVYELSLDANKGNAKIVDSLIFRRALSSFKFTYLLFNN
jgi:hypothetical protein